MASLHIRRATERDLDQLTELYQHLIAGDPRPTPDAARQILDRFELYPGSAILVGLCGATIVTSCTLVVVPNLTRGGSPYALIENVATHADYRKRGYGREVLAAAVDAAWNAGCYKAMLLAGSNDPATLGFYAGAGFEQSKTGFQVRRIPARTYSS